MGVASSRTRNVDFKASGPVHITHSHTWNDMHGTATPARAVYDLLTTSSDLPVSRVNRGATSVHLLALQEQVKKCRCIVAVTKNEFLDEIIRASKQEAAGLEPTSRCFAELRWAVEFAKPVVVVLWPGTRMVSEDMLAELSPSIRPAFYDYTPLEWIEDGEDGLTFAKQLVETMRGRYKGLVPAAEHLRNAQLGHLADKAVEHLNLFTTEDLLQTTWEDFQREGMELSSEDKVRLGLLLQIAKRNDWEESYPAMLLHLKNRTAVEETSTAVSQQRPLVNRLGTPDRSTNASISIRSPIGRKMSSGDESPLAGNWIGSPPDTQGCVHDEKNRPGVRLLQFTSTPTGFHGEENLSVDSLDVPVFADMRRVKTTRSDCGTFGHDSPPMSPLRFGSMPRFSGPTSCSSVYSPKRLSRASWSHDIESSMSTPAASVHLSAAESEFQVDMDSLERSIRVSSWASSREDDCRAPVHWDIESPRASISSHSSSSRPEGEIPVLETTSTPRSSSHSETCTPARQPALGESIFGNALTRALQGVSRRLWSESRDALPVINATPPASSINSYQSPGGADTPLIGSSLTFSGFPVPQISASTESPRVSRRRKPPALPASQSHGPHDGQADQSTRHDGKCASDLDVAEADAVQHEGWERPGPGEMDKAGDVDTAKLTLLRSLCGPEDNKASQYNTSDSVKNAPPVLAAHPPSYRKPSTMVGRRNSRRHGAGGSTKETVMDVSGLIVVREAGAIPPRPDSADEIEPKACKMDAFAALEAYYSETQGSIPGPNQPAATRQPIGCASLKEGQDVVVENLEGLEQHPAVVQKDDSLARRVPIHDRQIESKAADPRQFSSDGSAENPNDTAVPQSFRRPYRGSLEDSAEEDMEEVFFMADVDTTIAQGLPRKIQTSASVLRAW